VIDQQLDGQSDDAAVDSLLIRLADTDRRKRLVAVYDLGETRSVRAVRPLIRCLQATDEIMQCGALMALAKIGDTSVVPEVFEVATGGESVGVRATAMETLGAFGDRRAVALLGRLVCEEATSPRSFRKWATKLLVELRGTEAIPDLEHALLHARALNRWRLRRLIAALKKMEL
jgi:HEAT repeat protein